MTGEVRIATRRSRLALWQAEHVAARLAAAHPGLVTRLVPIVTEGDRIQDRSLAAVGGKGLFIKELENAMLAGEADVAVHSMKDVPAELPDGLAIATVLERADPCDGFVSGAYGSFRELPQGARVGTSSLRRQCQMKRARPDLSVIVLRGNVETRLRKLDAGEFDATVLAMAGLERLGLAARVREKLSPRQMLPAVGQGVIGIECRVADSRIRELLVPLEHGATRIRLTAERAFAARLGGSCQSPIAAYAELDGAEVSLRGLVGAPDGSQVFEDRISGPAREAASLGVRLAVRLMEAGAAALLAELAAGVH
ncbi:MAG TPA: hydroxymethylbilane synthase [Steroidobacteraceae bacterium]|nr:hydroxymethylbilane synthase [Steroidobacteraceae bacterium]